MLLLFFKLLALVADLEHERSFERSKLFSMDCLEVIDAPFMLVELLYAHLANPSRTLSFELTMV